MLHKDQTTIEMSFKVKVLPLKPPSIIASSFVYKRSLFSLVGLSERGVIVNNQAIRPISSAE